ncbi:8-oxo-dGTP pyrophosphatase MutT (NUDIX family) [Nakamurella sp. UYEF19]|uniref:NUDIX hydrolase n=1 Tax=Nakamurella sp. UYEF19 TaxID=1756392 RepID=UPI003398AD70
MIAPLPGVRELGQRLAPDEVMPAWLAGMVERIDGAGIADLLPRPAVSAPQVGRRSAVLMLFADGPQGPDLLLTARAVTLRSHAGQPAFPGGKQDGSEDAVATALREAEEETGLDPDSVTPVALLPDLFLGVTGFLVSPVVGYWHRPGPVSAVDPAETAAVARVPVADLADPARRGRVRHPSGYVGPAFEVADMVVWGFTAGLVEVLLDLGGWSVPWDQHRYIVLPELGLALPDPEAGHLGDGDRGGGNGRAPETSVRT